jgi:hypothetical protein
MTGLEVIAVGTDPEKVARLSASCKLYGVNLVVLGLGEKWAGFGSKYRWVQDHLATGIGSPDDMLVVMDGYDTLCQGEPRDIERQCRELCGPDDRILVSSEIFSWPPEVEHLSADFLASAAGAGARTNLVPPNIFPCAGQWAGTRRAVWLLTQRIREYRQTDDYDDQAALSRDMVAKPHLYALDYGCHIFQANVYYWTMANTTVLNRLLSITRDDRGRFAIHLPAKGTTPCFLHFNGTSGGGDHREVLERDHVAPLRRLWALPSDRLPPMPAVIAVTLPSRRAHMENFSRTERWPVEVMDAVTTLKEGHLEEWPRHMSRGEILCYMSHREALTLHLRRGQPRDLLVIEDDVGVATSLVGRSSREAVSDQWMRFASSDYDMLLLGRCGDACERASASKLPDSPDLLEPAHISCAHAYIVRWSFIPQLLGILTGGAPKEAYDTMLTRQWQAGALAIVASNPPILNQLGLPSTINGRPHVQVGDEWMSNTCAHPLYVIQDYVDLKAKGRARPEDLVVFPHSSRTSSVTVRSCGALTVFVLAAALVFLIACTARSSKKR